MSTTKDMSEYFQQKYNLPEKWEIYSWECIPKNEHTHMRLKGCLTSVFEKGRRKGQKKYTGEMEREFILSNGEVDSIGGHEMINQTGLFADEAHQVKGERVEFDFYPTPPGLTKSLIYHCPQLPQLIFEPCAGQGAISDVLRDSDRMVSDCDISWAINCPKDASAPEFWQYWADHMRRMPSIDCRAWATVTNPPFSLAAEILPLAYEHSPWGVAFLLRLSYLEATENRADWLQQHADNLRYVIPVSPRPRFRKAAGADSVTVAWMVWQKQWSWRSLGIKCPFIFENRWKNE